MKLKSGMAELFKPAPVRPATLMDRTSAAAREITDAATAARDERTARLRAARLGQQAEVVPEPAVKAPARRKAPKVTKAAG